MLNPSNTQRALRAEGPSATTPALRRSVQGHSHACFPALRQANGTRNGIACKAQSFGRGQPPNQPQPMSLVRRPFYDPLEPAQPTFLKLSEVMDKDVISSTTGRKLGKLGEAWVDASRLEVTCFDLESNGAIGVVPLLTIKQAGDVVLVQEDGVVRQPLDPRFGFTKLLGWEVRTPSNRALGKVRDLTFSRETGTISKLEYDDFGLRFLRADFFDRYSVPADAVRQCAYGIVSLAADNMQYQEKQGLLSSLLRRVGGAQQLVGLLADGSRGSEAAGLLPSGYSYEQWQNDVRMWEAQTGCSYEEYMMLQSGGAPRRNALPPGRPQPLLPEPARPPSYALPPASSSTAAQGPRGPAGPNPMQPQQAQMQQPQQPQGYGVGGRQGAGMYGGGGYGAGMYGGGSAADPRYRGSPAQPANPRVTAPQGRYPPVAGPQQPQQPQQQQSSWPQPGGQLPPAGQQQQWGQQQWAQQQPQQPGVSPQQQQPQPLQPQAQQPPGMQPQQPPQQSQGAQRPLGVGVSGRPPTAAGQGTGLPGGTPGGPPPGTGAAMQAPAQPQPQRLPPQQPLQPQQQPPQPQQQPQYGWPGPAPGPSSGMGLGAAQPGQNGAGAASGNTRVEDWLARGPQGQGVGYEQVLERPPTPGQPAVVAEPNGWDMQGSRQPQPY